MVLWLYGDLEVPPSALPLHFIARRTLAFIVPADPGGNEFMIPVLHSLVKLDREWLAKGH